MAPMSSSRSSDATRSIACHLGAWEVSPEALLMKAGSEPWRMRHPKYWETYGVCQGESPLPGTFHWLRPFLPCIPEGLLQSQGAILKLFD
jgi:hypothetical protein